MTEYIFNHYMENYHSLTTEKVLERLETSTQGLSKDQVDERLKKFGQNILPDSKTRSPFTIFLNQFKNTMVYILIAAATISFIYEHYLDVYVILGVIIINSIVGFVQEFQAERSIQALKKLIVQQAKVIRDSQLDIIETDQVVPGDILVLEEGDKIPADGRIIYQKDFQTSEASLTGESLPVNKTTDELSENTILAEQKNMVWTGTTVARGIAHIVVTQTGSKTALGQIAHDLESIEEKDDHFFKKTNILAKQMASIAIFTTVVTFLVGFFIRNFEFEEIFMFTIASLVAGIPEGLPVVLTIVLAIGARRMAGRNAIVRRLSSTETLSVVDTIITDKTGTLTQNKMAVTVIKFPESKKIDVEQNDDEIIFKQNGEINELSERLVRLLDIASLSNNVRKKDGNGETEFYGDPTEIAVLTLADRASKKEFYSNKDIELFFDLKFSQENRWRASLISSRDKNEKQIVAIGAPEKIIEQCNHLIINDGKVEKMTTKMKQKIHSEIKELANQGFRLLTFAYKDTSGNTTEIQHSDIENMTYVATIGIVDPPREEVPQAIIAAKNAGITTYMATGDHPDTAFAIAKEIGLADKNDKRSDVLTGAQIEDMTDDQIIYATRLTRVFARMNPEAKLRLASVLQSQGKVVAMTGDGINDAPALKQADIGIAMGKIGTDVARESADIVLSDDNYASIVSAVEEGRTQFRNIRRTSFFLVITNLAQSVSLIVFLIIGLPIPLLPKQILWLNLVTGGVTDVALATEPVHGDVLKTPPKSAKENILNRKIIPMLSIFTIMMVAISLFIFLTLQEQGEVKARTGVFVALALMQIFNLFNLRSLKDSVFAIGVFTNKAINIAFVVSILLLILVVYLPFLGYLFEFETLSLVELSFILVLSSSVLWVGEALKYAQKKKFIPLILSSDHSSK